MELIGIERKVGEYEGKAYDKTVLHIIEPLKSDKEGFNKGFKACLVYNYGKLQPLIIKTVQIPEITNCDSYQEIFEKCLDKEVKVQCGLNGTLEYIEFVIEK